MQSMCKISYWEKTKGSSFVLKAICLYSPKLKCPQHSIHQAETVGNINYSCNDIFEAENPQKG